MVRVLLVTGLACFLLAAPSRATERPARCPYGMGALPSTTAPNRPHGAQIPIDTIVVLMQENRSFDHYFAQLHTQGQHRIHALPRNASNPDPTNPGGPPIRPFHQDHYCEVADLDHSWSGTHREWNGGAMDGFTTANQHPSDPTGSRAMGYYDSTDLPFYYALYTNFAMADHFFCSALTQTFPNRFYLMAATSFGHIRNDFPPSATEFSQRTIFNALDEAGVTWKIYFSQIPFGFEFAYVRSQAATKVWEISVFYDDAMNGTLPNVSFVDPIFLGAPTVENDEHPPANIQVGQNFTAQVINAMFASPQWGRSAMFLTYDEHGGYWDHVPPPPACPPDNIPPNLQPGDEPGAFDRYGIRVPAVVISPYARRHYVSRKVYDHTSILRFIETRFDLPALTARDANADAMLRMFKFSRPTFATPPSLGPAPIDPEQFVACGGSPPPSP